MGESVASTAIYDGTHQVCGLVYVWPRVEASQRYQVLGGTRPLGYQGTQQSLEAAENQVVRYFLTTTGAPRTDLLREFPSAAGIGHKPAL